MDSARPPRIIMAAPVMPLREPSREVLEEERARALATENGRKKLGLCAVGIAFAAACAIVIFAMNRPSDASATTSRPEITSAEILVPPPPSTIALPLPLTEPSLPLPLTEPAPPPPQPSSISASVTPPPPMRVRRRGPPRR
jgi:hypothetical protein